MKGPNEDDYKKLMQIMRFTQRTKDDYLTLSANSLHTVRWWVDASYAVHLDMKSHTGGTMVLGTGVLYGTSIKHRMNTKSSTESDYVSADDVLPRMLWTFNSSKPKDTRSRIISYIKTTKVQSCWRPMDEDQVESIPAISM